MYPIEEYLKRQWYYDLMWPVSKVARHYRVTSEPFRYPWVGKYMLYKKLISMCNL